MVPTTGALAQRQCPTSRSDGEGEGTYTETGTGSDCILCFYRLRALGYNGKLEIDPAPRENKSDGMLGNSKFMLKILALSMFTILFAIDLFCLATSPAMLNSAKTLRMGILVQICSSGTTQTHSSHGSFMGSHHFKTYGVLSERETGVCKKIVRARQNGSSGVSR